MKSSYRLITEDDLPLLRKWRNANRNAFFDNREISEEEQREWYDSYLNSTSAIAIVSEVGCIGLKWVDGTWEIHSVMRGEEGNKGCMGEALRDILSYIELPVYAKVLKENKAIKWYLKNGFVIDEERENYFSLRFCNRP